MGPRPISKWSKTVMDEAAEVLESMDPESLTRSLTKQAARTGTSNPGWRLDTQGSTTNSAGYNIQLQPNNDARKTGKNAKCSRCKKALHRNSAACIVVADAFAEIDDNNLTENNQRIGQTMKEALSLSFRESLANESAEVVNIYIDGSGAMHKQGGPSGGEPSGVKRKK